MKVVIDSHIPYLRGLLEPYAEVAYLDPVGITPAVVRDADALLVRTRTRCDERLLSGSRVRFIGTATIGYDHIDTAYCAAHQIHWTNCPGCNALGVSDYVESAMWHLGLLNDPSSKTIGIVGVGHVGRLVQAMAERYGMRVLLCDPPRAAVEGCEGFVSLDEIAEKADIITFHTPLTKQGEWATWHMADERFMQRCKPGVLIINAARGGVVDEAALLKAGHRCVIDCWEGEPKLNGELLKVADFATFHIAGYTKLGKFRASRMVLEAFCEFFSLPALNIEKNVVSLQTVTDNMGKFTYPDVEAMLRSNPIFDIGALSEELKRRPQDFELLREQYVLR